MMTFFALPKPRAPAYLFATSFAARPSAKGRSPGDEVPKVRGSRCASVRGEWVLHRCVRHVQEYSALRHRPLITVQKTLAVQESPQQILGSVLRAVHPQDTSLRWRLHP